MTGWHDAYAQWLPDAMAEGHTEINDAFRAGFLAASDEVERLRGALGRIADHPARGFQRQIAVEALQHHE